MMLERKKADYTGDRISGGFLVALALLGSIFNSGVIFMFLWANDVETSVITGQQEQGLGTFLITLLSPAVGFISLLLLFVGFGLLFKGREDAERFKLMAVLAVIYLAIPAGFVFYCTL
jgi:hypothetical protein